MDKFTTEIIQMLAQNGNISKVFRSHLEKVVNTLLAQELTAFLDYEKYDCIGFNSGNSRNSMYERTLHTEYGDLKLEIPRDRNGDFRQQSIHRSIYSTNLIESVNKQLKKYTKRKEQFPNEASLERFLVSQLNDYNTRFLARCHLGFDQARAELEAMFDR